MCDLPAIKARLDAFRERVDATEVLYDYDFDFLIRAYVEDVAALYAEVERLRAFIRRVSNAEALDPPLDPTGT
jgi:hypothetical protein